MIRSHHLSWRLRLGLLGALAIVVSVGLALDARGSSPVGANPAYGTVKPNPQSKVVIQGWYFSVPVSFTTCTGTSQDCKLGAYGVNLRWDPAKVTRTTASGTTTGGNGATTFWDTTKSWKIDQWKGASLSVTSGACASSSLVTSNTSKALNLSPPLACAPASGDAYTLGQIADGGWLGSTGRPVNCPIGPTGGSNYAELHCITLGATPNGPTGTGNLTSAVIFKGDIRGIQNMWLTGNNPPTSVLRIDGYYIPADILDGTRRVILCPDSNGDGIVNAADLGATAAAFGKSVSNPGTPPGNYTPQKDPDENGIITAGDLGIIASVFGQRCNQP